MSGQDGPHEGSHLAPAPTEEAPLLLQGEAPA